MRSHKGERMDQDRVTRTTLPQVTVGLPLSLLNRVNREATEAGMSRSAWIVNAIKAALGDENGTENDEAAA